VQDASASFDRYWNSEAAYAIALLSPELVNAATLDKLRGTLAASFEAARQGAYAELLRRDDAVTRLVNGDWPMSWSSEYRFVADDPAKVNKVADRTSSDVLAVLGPVMSGAQQDLTIVSPYFVPRDGGTERLVGVAQSGRSVRVLTNSLAANDVAAVHGGYSEYREQLLEGGVQLWELKPTPGVQTRSTFFGSGGASLHTKGLAVDGTTLFVGSYNLDPRSTSLNTEQGVLVKSEALAQQFLGLFDLQTSGERAWRVTLQDGDLAWTDGRQSFDEEPQASGGRKFQAWVASWLPIESQL
jgi:putative cardiolipin synthase